jgi:hypothetical protein
MRDVFEYEHTPEGATITDSVQGWCYNEGVSYTLDELGDEAWQTGCPLCGDSHCWENITPEQQAVADAFLIETKEAAKG